MRPDRLVIGECRGAEAVPMLQAMNTGHDGSMTTLHANSARDALRRLESMALLGAPEWPIAVVREQIHAAIDVIVYLKRSGPRRVITEIVDVKQESAS
jgi:pilus assembly protein CpaF